MIRQSRSEHNKRLGSKLESGKGILSPCVLRATGRRKPLENRCVQLICQRERLVRLCHRRHDGVAGIPEFPGKDGEGDRGLYRVSQGAVQVQASAAQLVEVMRFLERGVVGGLKALQRFLRRLLTMK